MSKMLQGKMVFLIYNIVHYFTTEARRIYEYIWKKKDRDVFWKIKFIFIVYLKFLKIDK